MDETRGSDEIQDTPSERAETGHPPADAEKSSEAPGTTDGERDELDPGAAA